MKRSKVLSFDAPMEMEHPLFRICMQAVVGIEQGHSPERLAAYAKLLREAANQHIHSSEFA